jgi:hypothetical protein
MHTLTRDEIAKGFQNCAFLSLVVVLVVLFLCGVLGCRGRSEPAAEKPTPVMSAEGERQARAEAEKRAAESEKAAAVAKAAAIDARLDAAAAEIKAQKAEHDLKLGDEAGRGVIVQTANGVGVFGGVVAVIVALCLLVSVFGGKVAIKTLATGLALAAGCVVVRFFIVVYGYMVAKAVCWALLIALPLLTIFFVALGVQRLYRLWVAQQLAAKQAAKGADARDVFALLPVSKHEKGQLHDDWEYLRDPAPGDSRVEADARRRLARRRIPAPRPSPGLAAPAGSPAP